MTKKKMRQNLSHTKNYRKKLNKCTINAGMHTATTNGWTDGQTNDTAATTIKPEWHDASKIIRIIALLHFYPNTTKKN